MHGTLQQIDFILDPCYNNHIVQNVHAIEHGPLVSQGESHMLHTHEPYLSPRHLADALGVSESSVKRWADSGLISISRTAGGHRRIAVSQAITFIREQGLPIRKPGILGLTDKASPLPQLTLDVRKHLLAGDVVRLSSTLQNYYLHGGSLATLGDGPIRKAFDDIGELWQHRDDGIMIEHRAVDCCLQALTNVRNLLPTGDANAPCALGAAPPGDPYILPSLLAAMVLQECGWHAINLGPNTPWPTIATAVEQLKPKLLWLTVSAPLASNQAVEGRKLLRQLQSQNLAVSIGGRRVDSLDIPATGNSLQDLAAFAQQTRNQIEQLQ